MPNIRGIYEKGGTLMVPTLISCMTSAKLLNHCRLQPVHLQNKDNIISSSQIVNGDNQMTQYIEKTQQSAQHKADDIKLPVLLQEFYPLRQLVSPTKGKLSTWWEYLEKANQRTKYQRWSNIIAVRSVILISLLYFQLQP